MLNTVILQGRLVADPELRTTPNGVATVSFRLAVERDFKDKSSGERQADFIHIVAWRQTAEFVSRFFTKGRMAIIEGRLQIREYTDKEGNKRSIAEVVADHVYFGDARKDGGGEDAMTPSAPRAYDANPGADAFAALSDDDGDLPF